MHIYSILPSFPCRDPCTDSLEELPKFCYPWGLSQEDSAPWPPLRPQEWFLWGGRRCDELSPIGSSSPVQESRVHCSALTASVPPTVVLRCCCHGRLWNDSASFYFQFVLHPAQRTSYRRFPRLLISPTNRRAGLWEANRTLAPSQLRNTKENLSSHSSSRLLCGHCCFLLS